MTRIASLIDKDRRRLTAGAAALIVGVVLLGACANRPGAGTEVIVDAAASGDEVVVPESGILVVELDSNPSTGFGWELAAADPDALELLSHTTEQDDADGLVGAPGVEVWRFKALRESRSELTLEYVRPFERDSADTREFDIEVDVVKGDADIPPLHLHEEEHGGEHSDGVGTDHGSGDDHSDGSDDQHG